MSAAVGFLCDCIVPGRDKPKAFTGDIPWVTLPDIVSLEISTSSIGLGLTESEISEVRARVVPPDSVIMSCIGRFGISAVVKRRIVVNQQLHAFLPSNAVLPRYLAYHVQALREGMEMRSTSTTIAYLNKDNCNSLAINVPPLMEQEEIVRLVDESLCQLERQASECARAANLLPRLEQATLAKAFRGELVKLQQSAEPEMTISQ